MIKSALLLLSFSLTVFAGQFTVPAPNTSYNAGANKLSFTVTGVPSSSNFPAWNITIGTTYYGTVQVAHGGPVTGGTYSGKFQIPQGIPSGSYNLTFGVVDANNVQIYIAVQVISVTGSLIYFDVPPNPSPSTTLVSTTSNGNPTAWNFTASNLPVAQGTAYNYNLFFGPRAICSGSSPSSSILFNVTVPVELPTSNYRLTFQLQTVKDVYYLSTQSYYVSGFAPTTATVGLPNPRQPITNGTDIHFEIDNARVNLNSGYGPYNYVASFNGVQVLTGPAGNSVIPGTFTLNSPAGTYTFSVVVYLNGIVVSTASQNYNVTV